MPERSSLPLNKRPNKHSIEGFANRSLLTEKKIIDENLRRPNLEPTMAVVGDWQPPPQLKGNHPDVVLLGEARHTLKYKTNYTLLEWWDLFPVNKWWRYAIMATKALARRPNYKYFLRCLLTAATGGKKFEAYYQYLARFFKGLMEKVAGEKEPPPMCNCGSMCEKCYDEKMRYYGQVLPQLKRDTEARDESPGKPVPAPAS